MKNNHKLRSPWLWIPTVYIAEGLPYFAVNTLTVLMYVNMGVSLKDMAFFTGWLYLPWVIKPFWSPFIDIFKTKRWWVISMQSLIGICMACVSFLLPGPLFFCGTLCAFWLIAFFSATHDIAADGYYMIELPPHEQAAFVGVRSTFYRIASVIGQGGLVILAGHFEVSLGNVGKAWALVFTILSIFFIGMSIYHSRFMPRAKSDRPMTAVTSKNILKDFCHTFITFFRKPGIVSAVLFMLLYRLPEAMCLKLVQPFLVSNRAMGGLGLTTAQVGIANGTIGVIALLAGGILGGFMISRDGLKRWLWPMALSLTLPCLLYCILAMFQPVNFSFICLSIFIEQFGYGFGFSAFMLYLIYFSQGENKTSHYAFCTAFMALGMMIPGMFAGWIHMKLSQFHIFESIAGNDGYINFFWWVMLCCIPTFIVCSVIKIDPSFGKKTDN